MSNASSDTEVRKPTSHKLSWGVPTAITLVVALYFVAQFVALQLVAIYPVLKGWSTNMTNDWLNNSIIAQFIYVFIAEGLTVALLGWFLRRHRADFRLLGLVRPKLEDIGWSFTGLLIYFPAYIALVVILSSLIHGLNVNQPQQVGFTGATGWPLMLVFLSLVVLPPLVEELLFRGFLFVSIRQKLSFAGATLVTSLLFAAPHLLEGGSGGLLWIAAIDTFILSIVLCGLREKTGRLYAGIGLHALKNGIAFASLFLWHVH